MRLACRVLLPIVVVTAAVGCGGGKGAPAGDAGGAGGGGLDAAVDPDAATTDAAPVVPLEHVTSVFPARDATAVCTDAPLRLVFDTPPVVGARGLIRVFDAANPGTPVDSIDVAASVVTQTIGPRIYIYEPVIVTGNEAYVYLRKVLQPGGTYYVNIDPGVFLMGATGPAIGAVTDGTSWRFTVRTALPAADAAELRVTADGTGDFCTVQGAVDRVPGGNTRPVTIAVARGTYREIVAIMGKHALTIRGDDRNESVISYPNNGALQTPPGSTSMGTKWRAMVGVDGSNDLVIEHITLWNPSPQLATNGQAEALRVEGGARTILRDVTFRSIQDTLLLSGQIYVASSLIEGATDFIWGNGAVYFDRCEIRVVAKKGYNVQARNPLGASGYTFVGCTLTAEDGITGHFLARTDKNTTAPNSQVAYVDCTMGPHIAPAGWLIDGYQRPAADAGAPDGGPAWNLAGLRFGEYHSVDPAGAALDVSQRIPEAKQLTDAEAAQLRDPAQVFGGWNPRAAAADAGAD
jgi:pectin methylesterase-like acyl-CoA thioesterase